MSEPIDLDALKDKLDTTGPIFVLFGQNATIDHVGSALALFLSLKQAKKDVLVASPAEMRAEFTYLVGLDKVGKSIGNRNLVISFSDYTRGSIERVSHNDDINDRFELTIQPKSGHKAPDPKNIEYSYTGAQADIIFILGTSRLEDLGPIYDSERNLFHTATTVAINRRQSSTYANINVVDEQASSLAEITTELIEKLGLSLERDIASNLLSGLDFATNRFQNPVISSTAFTTAGKLLENGGKRPPQRISSAPKISGYSGQAFAPGQPSISSVSPFAQALSQMSANYQSPPPGVPSSQPSQAEPAHPSSIDTVSQTPPSSPSSPPDTLTSPTQASQSSPPDLPSPEDRPPPSDWTQPKIYKGSTRV